jgi:cyclic pyranopterin phosphate synthase
VLNGIQAAVDAGLGVDALGRPSGIKINMVVKRHTNLGEVLPMARHFRGSGMALRFIEYMDVGATNGWRMDEVLPSAQVIERLQAQLPLVALKASAPGETAQRWGYADNQGQFDPALGEIGVISSVTQAFCGDCSRARLSTEGQLYLCLFASQGYDLRSLIRGSMTDAALRQQIAAIWQGRSDRYSQLRSLMPADSSAPGKRNRVEMSYIGG